MSKTGSPNKVTFMDEHLENCAWEKGALHSKLQAKSEALKILAKELDKCRTERDQFKLMAEQLQERYIHIKKKSNGNNLYSDVLECNSKPGTSVAQLLGDTREQNKILLLELESTRQKLTEAFGDIRVLRQQLSTNQHKTLNDSEKSTHQSFKREELVQQLEKMNGKIIQMQADIQSLLDEKEELIKERDAFKHKAHRVGHELSVALRLTETATSFKTNNPALVDADGLISENRYLHERLHQAEAETQLATQALAKYKSMLESKRRKGMIKLGTNNTDLIMSHKQVKQLLEYGTLAELPVTVGTIADMKSLCLGLVEALEDKTLALAHQKKANKILATRVTELESRLESLTGTKVSVFPSQILLEDYCSAEADKQDITNELAELKSINKNENKKQNNSSSDSNNRQLAETFNSTSKEDCFNLPPKLQLMVQKALEDLQNESGNDEK